MKMRVADYIAKFLVDNGCTQVFSVVGGGAMYLNDAFGNTKELKCTYTHHEQAAALAAVGHARITGESACVCVTTGPGGTNALTGVLCAYQDNIPMLIVSGQVRLNTTVESTGLNLRQFGEQEYTIIPSVRPMTKLAVMIEKPEDIRYYLEKAYKTANSGRRGPCWIDVPLDIQGAEVEVDELIGYTEYDEEPRMVNNLERAVSMLEKAKRPVILAGSGLRTSGMLATFKELAKKWGIPVIGATSIVDYYPNNAEGYYGMFGVFGGRAGNFIVQNADVILSLGCRLSFKQIGFNYENFAPDVKKIVVDVDINELNKSTMQIDLPIHADLKDVLNAKELRDLKPTSMEPKWIEYCNMLKKRFPVYLEKFADSEEVNPYEFIHQLQKFSDNGRIIVVGNSVACVSVLQCGINEEGQRLFGNVNCGTMGYDIPAAVGAAIAAKREVLCITGDGSMQMNIQELQTIVHNKIPVKVIVFNNGGYQAIMQTQTNFFKRLSGCNYDSGISMPDLKKIAEAYGLPYVKIEKNAEIADKLKELSKIEGPAICELVQDIKQGIEPRTKSMTKDDGTLFSPPIDNLFPFLTEEEYKACQYENYK
ncbi:MAG: thiamine pyrophosphate-binding protein [Lachnospiraceae bacterium]|nr:thiamine pyrophosphate-binding protein [Lachnospiraceae bacterium]